MAKTVSKTVRLTIEEWAELDYAAKIHDRTRNDEIRKRLIRERAIPASKTLIKKFGSDR